MTIVDYVDYLSVLISFGKPANASGSVFRRSRLKRFRRFAGAALVFLGDPGGVLQCSWRDMGLRRAERQAASKRPAAKLGGGGGWNLKDRDPADPTPAPSYPGTSAGASRPWEPPRRDRAEPRSSEAVPADESAGPKKRAFSGKGWRAAAPGFDTPSDARGGQPASTEPKVLVGNLPTDVAPETLREILETACAGVDLGDAEGELLETRVAVFGPARPKLRRDKKRLHRGFAVLEYSTRAAAVAAAKALHSTELHTPSRKTEGGIRAVKASADVGPAMDAAFLNGEQGEDVAGEDVEDVIDARRALAPSDRDVPVKIGDPTYDPVLHDPDHPAYDASPPFAMRELATFPMRASCLATHATAADLDAQTTRPRFFRYLRDAVPGLPELAAAVRVVADVAPRWTRVKELVESVEAFRNALAFLAEAETKGGRAVETCFDMACGHGLVGVLIAYAFPEKTVRACDWTRRPAFEAYARVFGAFASLESKGGRFDYDTWARERRDVRSKNVAEDVEDVEARLVSRKSDLSDVNVTTKRENGDAEIAAGLLRALDETLPGETLGNVRFTEGDLNAFEPLVASTSFVLALHGCNESTRDALALAKRKGALWCVMPCCVVKDLYAPECVLSNLDDAARYAFLCGVLASKYGASLVRAVDKRITNRPVMLFGGIRESTSSEVGSTHEPPPAGPFQLRFPMAHKRVVSRVAARRKRAGEGEGGTGG